MIRTDDANADPTAHERRVDPTWLVVALAVALGATAALLAVMALADGAGTSSPFLPLFCLASVLASAGAAVAVRSGRSRQLASVEAFLNHAAMGRPSTIDPATVRRFPGLARAADGVASQLRRTALVLARISESLSTGQRGIHDVSEAISSGAEDTAARAAAASASASGIQENALAVAGSSEELAATINQVAGHAVSVSKITEAAGAQAERVQVTMAALSEASKQIEHVVGLINAIAGQTRMLSLNATIEAARAGSAGRGFAVVADEVRNLAQATADATGDVAKSVEEIQTGTARAESEICEMVRTIERIGESQAAIATAAAQQTNATGEIGRRASETVNGSGAIAQNVDVLTAAARANAYAGAQIRTTIGDLAMIGKDLAELLATFDQDLLRAELARQTVEVAPPTAIERNGVTHVEDTVMGSGEAEFEYVGDWCHSAANAETDGSNSYCTEPGAVANLRFTGTKVRFFAVSGPNHGIAAVSVDGGPEHTADMYSAQRTPGALLYESPALPHGRHTLRVRVTGEKNPQSRYTWVTIDRAEFQ